MLLVVFSYHNHYHITQLAVRKAIKHITGVTKVAIVWDDSYEIKPKVDLHLILREFNTSSYLWSNLYKTVLEEGGHGWFNQQVAKLSLDKFIHENEFIIMDGDLILNQNVDPVNIMYATQLHPTHDKYNHLNKLLGIYPGDFSNCPLMYVNSFWLKGLRDLVTMNSERKLYDLISDYCPKVNDWDLIAGYVLNVLKLPRRVEPFHYRFIPTDGFVQNYNDFENFVLKGNDLVDTEFWRKHNVVVDTDLYAAKL